MPPRNRPVRRSAAGGSTPGFCTLHGIALRIARGEDNLTPAELTKAGEQITVLANTANRGSSMLLVDLAYRTVIDLITLLGQALRRSGADASPDVDEGTRACYRKLRVALSDQLSKVLRTTMRPDISRRQMLLLSLVLRTHVLRCHARLLLGAAQQLKQRPSRRNVEAAEEVLKEADDLLCSLGFACTVIRWDAELPKKPRAAEDAPSDETVLRTKEQFLKALVSELQASQLFEAWATCYLQLASCGEWSSSQAVAMLSRLATNIKSLRDEKVTAMLDKPWLGSSTCLQYLLTSHSVRLAVLLDGGTSYGLPADAPDVPAYNANNLLIRRNNGGTVDVSLLLCALGSWYDELVYGFPYPRAPSAISALPPFNTAATMDICIRVANAAIAFWRAPPTAERRRSGLAALERYGCPELASAALKLADLLISIEAERDGFVASRSYAARLRAMWGAYVLALEAAMDAAEGAAVDATEGAAVGEPAGHEARPSASEEFGGGWKHLQPLLLSKRPARAEGVMLATAEAILSSNAIQIYERRLRWRITGVPWLADARTWFRLLLVGTPEVIVSLVATMAKCTRRCAAQVKGLQPWPQGTTWSQLAQLNPRVAEWPKDLLLSMSSLHFMFEMSLVDSLARALASGGGNGGNGVTSGGGNGGNGVTSGSSNGGNGVTSGGDNGGNGVTSGGGSDRKEGAAAAARADQCILLWSFVAVRLVPAVALALRCYTASPICSMYTAQSPASKVACPDKVALALLQWCHLLLGAFMRSQDRSAAADDAAAAAAAAAQQWRSLLLQDINLVEVLGAVCKRITVCSRSVPPLTSELVTPFSWTLNAACIAFPHELREALTAWRVPPHDAGPAASSPPPKGGHEAGRGGNTKSGGSGPDAKPDADCHGWFTMSAVISVLGPRGYYPDAATLDNVLKVAGPWRQPPLGAETAIISVVAPAVDRLVPPAEVRKLLSLHCCGNPECVDLTGPSDRSLARRRCGGCNRVVYCTRECQVAHWQVGHKAECVRGEVGSSVAG